jgi:hypothetical protein
VIFGRGRPHLHAGRKDHFDQFRKRATEPGAKNRVPGVALELDVGNFHPLVQTL